MSIKKESKISIVVVTYNNEAVLGRCVSNVYSQTHALKLFIVDNQSKNTDYLPDIQPSRGLVLKLNNNLGFCGGNNEGVRACWHDSDYILFLNPDAFLPEEWVEKALSVMEQHQDIGVLSGPLLGYDIAADKPTGRLDSLGIEQSWYGRWYDSGQGQLISETPMPTSPYEPKAICGALMLCRKSALEKVLLPNMQVFDESFFMYKEDIDLSLRVRKAGYRLVIHPDLWAYHCRGWNNDRTKVPRHLKLYSAKNELKLHLRQATIFSVYSLVKYLYVRFIER